MKTLILLRFLMFSYVRRALMYIFFSEAYGSYMANYAFYIKKPLDEKDFDSIKEGSHISDVCRIDEGFKILYEIEPDIYTDYSLHLVKDGIIFIECEYKYELDPTNQKDYVVLSKQFKQKTEPIHEQVYNLLEKDYMK